LRVPIPAPFRILRRTFSKSESLKHFSATLPPFKRKPDTQHANRVGVQTLLTIWANFKSSIRTAILKLPVKDTICPSKMSSHFFKQTAAFLGLSLFGVGNC
jgi:Rad3-related DNA helicase